MQPSPDYFGLLLPIIFLDGSGVNCRAYRKQSSTQDRAAHHVTRTQHARHGHEYPLRLLWNVGWHFATRTAAPQRPANQLAPLANRRVIAELAATLHIPSGKSNCFRFISKISNVKTMF